MSGKLNKAGYRSNRNIEKPYRPPRIKTDKDGNTSPNELDMMKYWAKEGKKYVQKRMNTTGCFGSITTGIPELRSSKFVVAKGLPGPTYRPRRKKSGGKLFYGNDEIDSIKKSLPMIKKIRGKIMTLHIASQMSGFSLVTDHDIEVLRKCTVFLRRMLEKHDLEEIYRQDSERTKSVIGMVKSGNVRFKKLRNLRRDIDRCSKMLRMK